MFDKDYPTEWALNPSNFRAMDSDQVDWAALAQEWIKMKETHIPSAPTPPSISFGEAPMDMESKDDEIPPAPPAPNISGTNNSWNRWNQWESNWNQTGSATNYVDEPIIPNNLMIPPPAPIISCTPAFVDPTSIPLASSPSFGYNTMAPSRAHFNDQVPSSSDFWINEQAPTSFFPKSRPAGIHRGPPAAPCRTTMLDMTASRNRDEKDKTPESDTLSTLDTIKRKQLPAWIREGLEKMEREKQKAVERERQEVLCKRELEARKKLKEQARNALAPDASKFDSDSERESTELETPKDSQDDHSKRQMGECDRDGSPDAATRPRKSRFRDASSPPEKPSSLAKQANVDATAGNPIASVKRPRLSKEELLQSLMLQVRRSLTEILLEVTNDEIMSTCEEVWKNVRKKGNILSSGTTAAPVAQITRRLGLGIYSDSDSESSDEHSVPSEKSIASRNDSDEELKENLRLRQQAFKKTEADIEASLAAEEKEDANAPVSLKHNDDDGDDDDVKNDRTLWFEKTASDVIASTSRSSPDRTQSSSSSSDSGRKRLSRRSKGHGSSNGKNSTILSPRRRNARSNERRYSSSRSRSRSKNDSSSHSCDSSSHSSKLHSNCKRRSRSNGSRSRSKSRSVGSKRTRNRDNLYSRSRHSRSSSTTSRSRSRSRKRSKSSYSSSKSTAQKTEAAKKNRSRSPSERSRRSSSRKSKSSHRQRDSHRRRGYERTSKKSTRHRLD